jgi:hypothetical protein
MRAVGENGGDFTSPCSHASGLSAFRTAGVYVRCDIRGNGFRQDAWREAGLPEEKVATLCRIAGAVDKGLFEGAGFRLENRTWTPSAKGCCFLRVLRG